MSSLSNASDTNRTSIGNAEDELTDFMETIHEHVPDASADEIQAALKEAQADAFAMQSHFLMTEKVLQILANR